MMLSKPLKMIKMSGAGNDFILVDLTSDENKAAIENAFGHNNWSQIGALLCDRHHSVGGDGAVFLFPPQSSENHFRWEFYNADGSRAEMCGNAARCAIRWARDKRLSNGRVRFESDTGVIQGEAREIDLIAVQLSPVEPFEFAKELLVNDRPVKTDFVNSGVPHLVLREEAEVQSTANFLLAQKLRHHPEVQPQGANVTFVKSLSSDKSDNRLAAVSYERGVEDFTLACGTGAIAAAVSHVKGTKFDEPISVKMPGGILIIELKEAGPVLVGEAKYIGDFLLREV